MNVEFAELFAALAAPIPREQVKVRQQSGRNISYITARVVMNRLDSVVGPSAWWDEYTLLGEDSVLCRLSIRLPDGRVLTKQDAGGYAGMADAGDDDKSAVSDALKRAAVKFGIGRELYGDGVAHLFDGEVAGHPQQPSHHHPAPSAPQQQQRGSNGHGNYDGPPRSGKALFAWVRDTEQRLDVKLLGFVNAFGKAQGWAPKLTEWGPAEVARAHAEAMRHLRQERSPDELGDETAAGGRG